MSSAKPLIFISYAHEDEPEHPAEGEVKWLSFVTGYLRPAIKHGAVDLWIDRLMPGGTDWVREIGEKLRACDILILLVSRHSTSSNYVVDKEIVIIRERQAKGEDVHFYPLVLTPTPKIALDLLRDKNLRPRDGKPFSDYPLHERYRHMNEAANEIAEIAVEIMKRKSAVTNPLPTLLLPQPSSPTASTTPRGIMGRAGTFVSSPAEEPAKQELQVTDPASLESWMRAGGNRVAAKLAARAVLRALPLLLFDRPHQPGGLSTHDGELVVSAIFRAAALAQFSGFVPPHVDVLRAWPEAAEAADVLATSIHSPVAAGVARAAASAVRSARSNVAADAVAFAVQAVSHAVDAISKARINAVRAVWESIRSDTVDATNINATAFARLPLWKVEVPAWANDGWLRLQSYLPRDHDWQVWIEWYEDRLQGGWRGEDYERVFVNLPKEEWDLGPAAANAWIKAHLPVPESLRLANLPEAVLGLDAPFAYAWTASQRVTVVAGAQNLPFYPHFSSEEDHRRALEACRVGCERLMKALRAGRYNARPEYGEALEYYLDDLPKTAGAGNILLANNQARILHDMFLVDVEVLSPGFASALKSVIGNQFALNAFYDLVQRHNEAVAAGDWSQPFPLDATKGFFAAIDDNTPRWFEPQVEHGLREVEHAKPPATVAPEPAPASAIGPPPLPPGTPDAQNSWRRQMATTANALWETFLEGGDMPVSQDGWRAMAEELGEHVRPILDFLRAQDNNRGRNMTIVFIEARPKGRREGTAIVDFVVEEEGDRVLKTFKTQAEAITWAKSEGHSPHVARVRHLNDKKIPDHWRPG